jgi:hypothetical protein
VKGYGISEMTLFKGTFSQKVAEIIPVSGVQKMLGFEHEKLLIAP